MACTFSSRSQGLRRLGYEAEARSPIFPVVLGAPEREQKVIGSRRAEVLTGWLGGVLLRLPGRRDIDDFLEPKLLSILALPDLSGRSRRR